MVVGGRYCRISPEVLERVVDAYLDGEDWKQMGRFNRVNTKIFHNGINISGPSKVT